MADWVHCNFCYRQPADAKQFFLTTCGHLYCQECVEKKSRDKCYLCNAKCTAMLISSKMKQDVWIFFNDPNEIMTKQRKQLLKVIEFQKGHRKRLFNYYKDKITKLNLAVKQSQLAIENLKSDLKKTKEDNIGLVKTLNSMASPHQIRRSSGSIRKGDTCTPDRLSNLSSSRTPPVPERISFRTPPSVIPQGQQSENRMTSPMRISPLVPVMSRSNFSNNTTTRDRIGQISGNKPQSGGDNSARQHGTNNQGRIIQLDASFVRPERRFAPLSYVKSNT